MKPVLLACASALAISSVANAKQLETQVVVDLGASYAFLLDKNVDEDELEFGVPRADGGVRVNFGIDDNFSVQFDVDGELNILGDEESGTPGDTSSYDGALQGAAHLSYREPGQYLVGVFGAVGQAFINDSEDELGVMGGIEGQYLFGDTTLYGQVGGFKSSENDAETLTDTYFVRGVLRHFLTPDSALSIEGLYGDGESSEASPVDIDLFGWGLRYTRGFQTSMPIYGYLGYNGHRMTSDGERVTEHVVSVGISIPFGGPSGLQERNARGVTLDTPLDLIRTAGYTADIID